MPAPHRSTARACVALVSVTVASTVLSGCFDQLPDTRVEVALAPDPAACSAAPTLGRACGCVYDLPVGTHRLPDFSSLHPVELVCVDKLAVSLRKGPGFPGVTGRYEWFGADFQGAFLVERPGTFSFRLASDDGAKLFIDDAMVLNNDGIHDVRVVEGTIELEAGPHRVRVPYYDGPGPMALTLEVARAGEPFEIMEFGRPL